MIFIPIPLPKRLLQTSYSTHFFSGNVLRTFLGMGMANVIASNECHSPVIGGPDVRGRGAGQASDIAYFMLLGNCLHGYPTILSPTICCFNKKPLNFKHDKQTLNFIPLAISLSLYIYIYIYVYNVSSFLAICYVHV